MARRGFPWPRVAVLAVLLGLQAWVLATWSPDTLGRWLSIAGGAGVTVACAVWVARGIVAWWSGGPHPDLARIDRVAAELGTTVRQTWARS